jgi:hypothetical protein
MMAPVQKPRLEDDIVGKFLQVSVANKILGLNFRRVSASLVLLSQD